MLKRTRRQLLAIMIPAALLASACGGASTKSSSSSLETVRFAVWGPTSMQFAEFVYAQKEGVFTRHGIKLDMFGSNGGGNSLQALIGGAADVSMVDYPDLLVAKDKGAPVEGVYDFFPKNEFTILAPKADHITDLSQLEGKRVGVNSLASGSYFNLLAVLSSKGISPSKVDIIATGPNFGPALAAKRVDAVASWGTANITIGLQTPLSNFDIYPLDSYLPAPTGLIVTKPSFAQHHTAVLTRFLQAIRDMQRTAVAQPEQVASVAAPLTPDGSNGQAYDMAQVKLNNDISNFRPVVADHGLGWFDMTRLHKVDDFFSQQKLVGHDVPPDQVVTNQYVQGLDSNG